MVLKGRCCQLLGCVIMSFPKFLFGFGSVWPSYTILLLRSPSTPLDRQISLLEASLVGSLPLVIGIVSSPCGGPILDRVGRIYAGILTVAATTISWTLIAATNTVPMVLLGRCLFGISGGLLMQVAWSFTAEVSEDSIRGFMSSLPSVTYAVGALCSVVMGWVSDYQTIVYTNIGLSVVNAVAMWMLPESPVYLNFIGKEQLALKSLAFYRGLSKQDERVVTEMAKIKKSQDEKQATLLSTEGQANTDPEKVSLKNGTEIPAKVQGFKYLCANAASRRTFIVILILLTLSILSGAVAVQVYGGPLFQKATPSLSPDLCAVLLGVTMLIGSFSGAACTDLFGRRVMLMTAATINAICMLLLGTLVRWPWAPVWVMPALILLFSFVFNFGGGTIPYLLLAECFVPDVKGFVLSMIMCWLYVVNFFLLLAFVPAVELLGLDIVMYFFCACALSTTVLTHYLLPETRGLSAFEIEELFVKNK